MNPLLGRVHSHVFALFRIVIGLLFACHGGQKLLGFPPGGHGRPPLASLFGIGGIIELVCGLLVAVGLLGSVAAFIASGEMAVAYFMAHAPHGFWPIENKGELAVVYCFVFLYIAAHGSGDWSIDSRIKPRRTWPHA
jgi:putative oxidoreductase